jgi:hypothetical protein
MTYLPGSHRPPGEKRKAPSAEKTCGTSLRSPEWEVQGHLLTYGGQAAPTIKTATSEEMEFFVPIRKPPVNTAPLLATWFDET